MKQPLMGLALLSSIFSSSAGECGLQSAGNFNGTPIKVGESKTVLFITSLNVNTDGTKRSYSLKDFWGKESALNNPCNAMTDKCAGFGDPEFTERRKITQKAYADGWPKSELAATKLSSGIIPMKNGKPCPLMDGFLVSGTALSDPEIDDVCDLRKYADAMTLSALVIPRGSNILSKRGVEVGDLGVAITPGSGKPIYFVVGDKGPPSKLGEASVALNRALLDRTGEPENRDEVLGRGKFKGQKSWLVKKAAILIFAGSKDTKNPYMSADRIASATQPLFEKWGGVEHLESCSK